MSHSMRSLLFGLTLTLPPCGVYAAAPLPSAAEWQRVLAGEYVARHQSAQEGELSLIGGTAWLRIDAPADAVWRVVVRPDLYRHLLPYAVEAVAVEQDVVVRHKVIFGEVAYRVRFAPDHSARVLRFRVPSPWGALRAGWGELRVQPLGEDKCVVTWSIMAHPDVGFMGLVFQGAVQRAMLDVPKLVRRYVVQRGRGVVAAAP